MNQQSNITALIQDIKKTFKIHEYLMNDSEIIHNSINTINNMFNPDTISRERRSKLQVRLEMIDMHIDFYAGMIADSANRFMSLVRRSNYEDAIVYTRDDLYEIEGDIDSYVGRHYSNSYVFDTNIDAFLEMWYLKRGVNAAGEVDLVAVSGNLNINSNYNDDEEEPQSNSNDTFDQTLLPGHDCDDQVEERVPIAVHNEVVEQIVAISNDLVAKEMELLELKEDSEFVYKAIEDVIPFHEERIVTRSLAKKVGENGIKLFELENHYESHLGKKRKELKGIKSKLTN